jgi:hypothetical protein
MAPGAQRGQAATRATRRPVEHERRLRGARPAVLLSMSADFSARERKYVAVFGIRHLEHLGTTAHKRGAAFPSPGWLVGSFVSPAEDSDRPCANWHSRGTLLWRRNHRRQFGLRRRFPQRATVPRIGRGGPGGHAPAQRRVCAAVLRNLRAVRKFQGKSRTHTARSGSEPLPGATPSCPPAAGKLILN